MVRGERCELWVMPEDSTEEYALRKFAGENGPQKDEPPCMKNVCLGLDPMPKDIEVNKNSV